MSHTESIKRGDLMPPFEADLTSDGVPVDLTAATTVRVIGWRNNLPLFNRPVTMTNEQLTAGHVLMNWQATDTDTVADLYIEVEVTWVTGKPQTFPDDGWMVVHVTLDLT